MKFKATLPIQDQVNNGENHFGQKELVETHQVVAQYKNELVNPITVCFWMGRSVSASVVYCSIWVNTADRKAYYSGHGTAGGGGYDKQSAALESAIRSAGIKIDRHFGGSGEQGSIAAIEAITRAAGFRKFTIV